MQGADPFAFLLTGMLILFLLATEVPVQQHETGGHDCTRSSEDRRERLGGYAPKRA